MEYYGLSMRGFYQYERNWLAHKSCLSVFADALVFEQFIHLTKIYSFSGVSASIFCLFFFRLIAHIFIWNWKKLFFGGTWI